MEVSKRQMKRLRDEMEYFLPIPKLAFMTDEEVERELYRRTLKLRPRDLTRLSLDELRDIARELLA